MSYSILMGIPGMEKLWNDLQQKHRGGLASKDEANLYKKWGKAYDRINLSELPPIEEV